MGSRPVVGFEVKSAYVPMPTNHLLGLLPSAFASSRLLIRFASYKARPIRPRKVREGCNWYALQYSNLGFAIEDVRGTLFSFQQLGQCDREEIP